MESIIFWSRRWFQARQILLSIQDNHQRPAHASNPSGENIMDRRSITAILGASKDRPSMVPTEPYPMHNYSDTGDDEIWSIADEIWSIAWHIGGRDNDTEGQSRQHHS
jgi:hypothetical protein